MTIQFTNCVLAIDGVEVKKDLYMSSTTGTILPDDALHSTPQGGGDKHAIIDLGGRLVAPGMIDIQLNGALGFDFSMIPEPDAQMPAYAAQYRDVCRGWIETGVTSFLPTVVTNPADAFRKVSSFVSK